MEEFARLVRSTIGIQLNKAQLKALSYYEQELLDWNARMNLTAIQHPEQVRLKHFLDSLTCLMVMREQAVGSLIDIGTGAGFPGLPLKIALPDLRLTLVESVGKKVAFCKHIVEELKLEGVEIIQARAETVGQESAHRQRYDWAVARAVANLPVLVEYLLPLVKLGGVALAMKGESGPAEAHEADFAIQLLGGHLRRLIPIALPGVAEERYLVVIDKVAATPAGYPRRVGVPTKRPLHKRRLPV